MNICCFIDENKEKSNFKMNRCKQWNLQIK